jgi:hypothetical protein
MKTFFGHRLPTIVATPKGAYRMAGGHHLHIFSSPESGSNRLIRGTMLLVDESLFLPVRQKERINFLSLDYTRAKKMSRVIFDIFNIFSKLLLF